MAGSPFLHRAAHQLMDRFDPIIGHVLDPFENFSLRDKECAPSRQYVKDANAAANTQVDWLETTEAHIFKADLPGLMREDVRVKIEDGQTLEISGERKKEEVQKTDTWHRVERTRGTFLRRFRLPENIDTENVKAQVENGVLTITLPKILAPKTQVRTIEVQ
ncbi:HSP20 family protein [Marchantia polymorpha subsp. ruderalis]|uniref:Uncharacterized protein n=2 Tax=Marchantia polymorpha TaxID=3197 RepID=A0A176WDP1_MARPO|nr:hypothetical protein AXG93_4295s2040 [Marchantia polymorpha subsp. ruderalis]PTQ37549.1 hypothetical protein MARPO_0056s0027 [Marchantia polymorpha]PTQ37550.1 hypothetical protein MARPO_0056s0027 [Marchantia polymorpha]BBN14867.1 hypothetical protein Mp_6g15170 [Marchantia polymorpha subsp. ruderalis]BBN14868.1 hypothetical protein Mp_6g15170 [Marchantia polymorpha subsp. ruderalis]|eukprot:PTQ37549.1 hypothetical protein MARPO_0056s0027 [Marchantia polymorpha]